VQGPAAGVATAATRGGGVGAGTRPSPSRRPCDDAEVFDDPTALLERLHAAPTRLVYEFAGAGVSALAELHAVGGSSRTLLEATDRYAEASLSEGIGGPVVRSVDPDVAAALAQGARRRARHLAGVGESVAGVGLTATIATDRLKRGEHRVWVAAADGLGTRLAGIVLRKAARPRGAEERLVGRLALRLMAEAKGVLRELSLDLEAGETVVREFRPGPELLAFAEGRRPVLAIDALGGCVEALPWPVGSDGAAGELAVVSGAFHPLHDGHLGLAGAAQRHLGRPVAFELAVANADKPTIDLAEVHRRAAQFAGRAPLLLTRVARFDEKAAFLPGTVFVLGADTAARVLEARFYPGPDGLDAAMDALRAAGGRFLVAGRRSDTGFLTLDDLPVPARHADLFEALPATAFRADVSSSEIRAAWSAGAVGPERARP
jgi:hypothetical protein